ncbi:hypothetical protein, partial [Runella sp.]|uniref:hypothetical protein n=1 Tax=Runella sp. TaxID=1960881 RepID=UPI003015EC30
NNPEDWVSATDFGAQPANPQYGFFDATDAIQAAFNSGKKCVYFGQIGDNNTAYCIYRDIIIPPTVELITGFNLSKFNFFNGSKFIVDESHSAPLFIERAKGIQIENNSMRTLVLRSLEASTYQNTMSNTNGKVFLEDWVNRFNPQFPVQLWARHFNTEVQPEDEVNIENPGGKYWILGLKTEGRANIIRCTQGGLTEVLGGLIYPSSSFSGTVQAAFVVQDACLSTVGLTMTSYVGNGWYGIAVDETQAGQSYQLPSDSIWANSAYNFSFYKTGGDCNNLTPVQDLDLEENINNWKPVVYPNPTNDFFQINASIPWARAVLKNNVGQTMRSFIPGSMLRVSGLEQGLLFLELYGANNARILVTRLVKI